MILWQIQPEKEKSRDDLFDDLRRAVPDAVYVLDDLQRWINETVGENERLSRVVEELEEELA